MTHEKVTQIQQALADALDLIDSLPADVRGAMTERAAKTMFDVGGAIEDAIGELSEDAFVAQAPRVTSL